VTQGKKGGDGEEYSSKIGEGREKGIHAYLNGISPIQKNATGVGRTGGGRGDGKIATQIRVIHRGYETMGKGRGANVKRGGACQK